MLISALSTAVLHLQNSLFERYYTSQPSHTSASDLPFKHWKPEGNDTFITTYNTSQKILGCEANEKSKNGGRAFPNA